MILYWRHKFQIIRKRATTIFEEAYTPEHIKQKDNFLTIHHPITESRSWLYCSSTDESGFYSNISRTYGYSKIYKFIRKVKKSKKLAAESYRNNQSRVYFRGPKKIKI